MSLDQSIRDLQWALQAIKTRSFPLHNLSFHLCQPSSSSQQETGNSMNINISTDADSIRYFPQLLNALVTVGTNHKFLRNLEFHCVKWGPKELQDLCSLLDISNVMQTVFRKNSFELEGLFALSEMLKRNHRITSIIFSECQIGSLGAGFLASALKANETMEELQIWEDSITSKGAEELSKMIEVNSTIKLLVIFDLNHLTATPIISSVIARNRLTEVHIWSKDNNNKKSKVLEFVPEDGALRIYKLNTSDSHRVACALGWNRTVRSIDLTGIKLRSKWAKEFRGILEQNKSLKTVILSKTCLRDKAVIYIAAGLFKNHILENLQLDENWFSAIGVEHLLCPLSTFSALQSQANTSLKSLTFGGGKTMIGRDGITAILHMLSTNQTIVSFGIINDASLKADDVSKIFRTLERNATLRQLSLRACKGVEGEPVLQTIMDMLQVNPWIEEIDLTGTPLQNAGKTNGIYQKLCKNETMEPERDKFPDLPMTMPRSCRIFFCGQELAGKTTLCNSICQNFYATKIPYWDQIRTIVSPVEQFVRTPEIKIKAFQDDDIKMTLWVLPGPQEFYTLHDLMFPGSGSPALFVITSSLFRKLDNREPKAIELKNDIQYWLRFIVSNSRTPQPQALLPNVTIVLTHSDKITQQSVNLHQVIDSIRELRERFQGFVEFSSTVFTVDARSSGSVSRLTHYLRKTSRTVLQRVPKIYQVCNDVIKFLSDWRSDNHNKPAMKWNEYCELCQLRIPALRIRSRRDNVIVELRRRAVAHSLHRVGEVIFFEELNFLILDCEWFYTKVLGRLIRLEVGKTSPEKNGLVRREELETILRGSLQYQIQRMGSNVFESLQASDLINMMLKLELCYAQNPGDPNSLLLIPAILQEGGVTAEKWQLTTPDCVYVGRHLECDDASHMFLTAGFFPRLQVNLHNKIFGSTRQHAATYSLKKYLISITINGIHLRVELGGQLGYHMDILACSTKNITQILQLFKHLVIPTIQNLCQKMNLTEKVIRPQCVEHLIPHRYRKNQYVSLQQLKQALLTVPAESMYEYQHTWSSESDGNRLILQSGFDYARNLLSDEDFREVLHRRYYDLQHLANELAVPFVNVKDDQQVDSTENECIVEPSVAGIAKGVETVLQRLKIIEHEIKDLKQEIQGLKYYEQRLLIELHRKVDYILNYNIQLEERKVPHMFYFVKIENLSKRLVTKLISGMTALRLHILCEFRREMHVVEDQIGCELMQIDNQALRSLLPYMTVFMKLLTLALKIGAHFVAGMGEIIPDLSREVTHLVGSPVLYGTVAMAAGAIGATAIGQVGGNRTRSLHKFSGGGSSRNFGQDLTAARQWLTDFLREHRISTGKDIAEKFALWRVRYRDDGHIAWVCQRHKQLRASEVIEVPI